MKKTSTPKSYPSDKKTASLKWIEILISGPAERKDEAAEILIDAGSPGLLELRPEEVEKSFRKVVYRESFVFKAYIPESLKGKKDGLIRRLKGLGCVTRATYFSDLHWQEEWKKYIKPVRIRSAGRKGALIVKPTWKKVSAGPGDKVIEIDPGMAFGTGEHATTKMCLRAVMELAGAAVKCSGMLDVGTGSGILSIAASKLGIKGVVATDTDPEAIKTARENIKKNRAKVRITYTPVERMRKRYPLVTANIDSKELIRLSPFLVRLVSPKGRLVLSGIPARESGEVKKVYRALGMRPVKSYRLGGWAAMVLQK